MTSDKSPDKTETTACAVSVREDRSSFREADESLHAGYKDAGHNQETRTRRYDRWGRDRSRGGTFLVLAKNPSAVTDHRRVGGPSPARRDLVCSPCSQKADIPRPGAAPCQTPRSYLHRYLGVSAAAVAVNYSSAYSPARSAGRRSPVGARRVCASCRPARAAVTDHRVIEHTPRRTLLGVTSHLGAAAAQDRRTSSRTGGRQDAAGDRSAGSPRRATAA